MVKEIMNVKSKELISTEDDDTSDVEVETKKTTKRLSNWNIVGNF